MNVFRTFQSLSPITPKVQQQMAKGKAKLSAIARRGRAQGAQLPNADFIMERSRGYQMEMFEESLRRNIIVAMDTGSGKTHIAVLRIQAELDKGNAKLCWFLVPNVALGSQQYEVLKSSLPPIKMEFLSGIDKVDKWSDQDIWDGVLGLTREESAVIISTHQVLLDALTHGFVKIEKIGLLIFDEAHHCVNYHPANRIMQDFYHPRLQACLTIPSILGLTASPVVKAKPDQLRTIETNLNAIARTPVLHRQELLKHVYPPTLKRVLYSTPDIYETIDLSHVTGDTPEESSDDESTDISEEDTDPDVHIGLPVFEGEFESIDPTTGEPYMEGDYEIIDPMTGEPVQLGGAATNTPAFPNAGDYEVIDPVTGETYTPSPPKSGSASPSPSPPAAGGTPPEPGPRRTMKPQERSSAFESLQTAYWSMDILEDPYIVSLRRSQNPDQRRIDKLVETRNTYSQNQMKGLVSKATHIRREYGPWATEWYIKEALRRSLQGAEDDDGEGALMEWNGDEKKYLKDVLKKVVLPAVLGPIEGRLTDKVERLIEVLVEEHNGEEDGGGFAGLVFVEQRVEVTVLQQILMKDKRTKEFFRSGTIVGAGQGSAKVGKGIYELVTPNNQIGVIEGFRSGKVNLLISTSVVEEGLDIPACHLVVCFSLPQNLKSFIQRRGRARRAKSTYVLMFEEGDREGSVENFERREREMIAEYLDETRELEKRQKAEKEVDSDEEAIMGEGKKRRFLIESTGACLTLDSAVSHLHHFSDCLPQGQYMNLNPVFTCEPVAPATADSNGLKPGRAELLYTAEVLLPNCIPPSARRTSSREAWPTEKWAKRDAAFEAYVALYHLKLVDDHLMPLLRTDADEEAMKDVEKRPAKVSVDNTLNPWVGMEWKEDTVVYETPIKLRMPGMEREVEINMLTSVECPSVDPIAVYWTNKDIGEVTIGESRCLGANTDIVERGKQTTYALLSSPFGSRMRADETNFPYLFAPTAAGDWDTTAAAGVPANALAAYNESGPICDLVVNDETQNNLQFVVKRWRTDIRPLDDAAIVERYGKKAINPSQPVLEAVKITKRRDFLHPESNLPAPETPILLLPQYCTLARIPWRYSQLALFLPGIIRRVEISLIAADLQSTLLAPVGIKSTSLVVISICASAARERTDYQRFEFLGDSVMKFLTSVNLVDEHPLWHEGYLASKKDRLVSNARLAKAAQDKKLARWIITQIFTGVKWTPHYIGDKPEKERSGGKELSTKILADVVESLIGAAYLEGGYEKALKCINLFVPENNLKPLPTRIDSMFQRAGNPSSTPSAHLRDLETLIGYTFRHKALLVEAITHPSYSSDMNTVSYQRLEFLGDAILDMIVVPELFHHPKQLSHIDMHLFKASVVNAHFLAFLSLGFSATLPSLGVTPPETPQRDTKPTLGTKPRKVELWKFMRHQHTEMTTAQKSCWSRYDAGGFRDRIQKSLDSSADYPWTTLYGLEADKFFSDIVEALLGAIFVDSGGDFGPVTGFAELLGVLRTMRRVVADEVDVTHPVKKLGELVAENGQATVEYVPSVARGRHVCTVLVNGEFVAEVGDGSSAAEARVRAAEVAYDTLRLENPDMKRRPGKPTSGSPSPSPPP